MPEPVMPPFGLLLLNASLLLAIGFLFDLFGRAPLRTLSRQCLAGAGLAAIAIAVMSVAVPLGPGLQFDARSVVLSVSGLFFGPLPTLLATLGAAAYRWQIGGSGAFVGMGVVVFSALAGLAYRHALKGDLTRTTAWHLLAFGLLVHGSALTMQLALPDAAGPAVIQAIAVPVLVVFPSATAAVGWLLVFWLRREAQARRVSANEDQLRLLAEHAKDLIYRYEFLPAPRFTYMSPSSLQVTGYSPAEFYRDPAIGLQMIVGQSDAGQLETMMRSLTESPGPVVLQWRRKDGRLIWTEQHNFIVRDKAGTVIALEGVARDVSDRENALALLKRKESEYRGMFEGHPTPMWVFELPSLRFLAVNEAAIRHYGYSRDEFLSMTIADIRPADDVPRLLDAFNQLRQNYRQHRGVWRHRTKDGRLIDVEIAGHSIEFDGRRAELILATDVTSIRAAERERERLVAAIEQSPDSVVITNADGAITYVNPAFEEVSGYSRQEAIGQNPRILKSGLQDGEFYRALWTTVTGGNVWGGRLINRRKDGSLYTEDASIAPVRDADQRTVAYVAVKRDVTRQIELEAQYLQAQKMESVGRLAAGVAHDFNNLLTIINSSAELALLDVPADAQVAEDLRQIQAAGTRASALTRQLLAFSRQQIVKPIVLGPDEALEGFRKILSRLVKEDVRLAFALNAPGCLVRIDPGQFEQIVMNLVVNARDAMPRGGVLGVRTAHITLTEEDGRRLRPPVRAGSYARVSVVDSGTGMSPEVQEKLFIPFFTTKDIGKGTGLGLATVLRIVSEAGGGLAVTSSLGAGSCFDVYLPLAEPERPSASTRELLHPTGRRVASILVVEDEESLRQLAVRVLQQAGYVVHQAANGRDALNQVAQIKTRGERLDMVMTDVIMPQMGGRELAERLAEQAPGLRLLYTSGYTADAELSEWLSQAKVPFLAKPYSPEGLLRTVSDVIAASPGGTLPSSR